MPSRKRHPTPYPGVYFVMGKDAVGKPEKVFYIRYYFCGKRVDEKAGRQYRDDMTPAKANQIRARRVHGDEATNRERREAERKTKQRQDNRWTLQRVWETYKETYPNLKGIVTDENRFTKHLAPAFQDKELSEIVPLDVDRLRINLMKKRSPKTVANVLELLRRLSNFAEKKQLCPGLSFSVQLPRVNNQKTEDLTPEELARLLEVLDTTPHKTAAAMMKMALYAGMRRGELFHLEWDHINFERGFISLVDPKGGLDQRIPLNARVQDLLKSIKHTDSPYVFPGKNGGQRTDIKRQVNHIKAEAQLPKDFRALHGLRHVFASALASSGQVDMYTLQKLLTHKSSSMTQRYAHLRDEALKRAANVAGDVMKNARGLSELRKTQT